MNFIKKIHGHWIYSPNMLFFLLWSFLEIKRLFKIGFTENCKNCSKESIDVIIPTTAKDYGLLPYVIRSLKNVCQPINKIFIISDDNQIITDLCKKNGCNFIDEKKVLGYGKEKIAYRDAFSTDRSGWLFQQLLKLSGDTIVEKENYLVLDSDTVLINKHNFIKNEKFIFSQDAGYNKAYFNAFNFIFKRIAPNKLMTTCHMMIFNKKKLKEMKTEMENIHARRWDEIIIATKNLDKNESSCHSEYDTYPNWLLMRHPSAVEQKPFYNRGLAKAELLSNQNISASLDNLKIKYGNKYNSISFHSYLKSNR